MCFRSVKSFISGASHLRKRARTPAIESGGHHKILWTSGHKRLSTIFRCDQFLPQIFFNIADTQALLQEVLKSRKKGSQTSVNWAPDRKAAFNKLKDELANATLLAFPDSSAQFTVQTDISGSAIGTAITARSMKSMEKDSIFRWNV